jgi:hypothetical protein
MNMKKLMTAGVILAMSIVAAQAGTADYSGVGTWHTPGNWTGGTGVNGLPGGSDYVHISGGGVVIDMNADTWAYFTNNAALTGGSTGEYRTQSIRLAGTGDATLNIDIGDGRIWRTVNSTLQYVGSASGSSGIMNINSGDIRIETSSFRIAEKAGSTGLLTLDGSANTRLIIHRESGGVSLQIGTGGDGTLDLVKGKLRTRAGAILGSNGHMIVNGSEVTEISIGDENSLDGNWIHNAGGLLDIGIDSGGLTPIVVADKGGSGTYATLDSGALLDVGFLGASQLGTWTVLEVENGSITDNGLAFAAGVDTGIWSYNVDNSGANGILTVTAIPEPATIGLLGMVGVGLFAARRFRS